MKSPQNMELILPPKVAGKAESLNHTVRRMVVIGANGTGKTRFAVKMASDLGDKAYRLSALKALYTQQDGVTDLERLLHQLMHDELLNLLHYKLSRNDSPRTQLPHTRLDSVVELWQDIFPGNRILVDNGTFLFTRYREGSESSSDEYSAVKLSDGERAVLYYAASLLYAPKDAIVFVDSPEIFLHPTSIQAVWNRLEMMRADCRFVYVTHDLEFVASRRGASVIWVRDYDSRLQAWDYALLPKNSDISEDMYQAIIGARKPVLFIEGDGERSIDAKLYPLIFRDYTVKSLGSCNKVIEATRIFNELRTFHQMQAVGIVDRDRRDGHEVEYLRGKRVLVPDVAEIENILMLEDVVRAVASFRHLNETKVFNSVKRSILNQFESDLDKQALQHTRHRVKRTVEYTVDRRFESIDMMEQHLRNLPDAINPRALYRKFHNEFRALLDESDYNGVLRVYNQKSMVPNSGVASLCGLSDKDAYIRQILTILRKNCDEATRIRAAVLRCFKLPAESMTGRRSD